MKKSNGNKKSGRHNSSAEKAAKILRESRLGLPSGYVVPVSQRQFVKKVTIPAETDSQPPVLVGEGSRKGKGFLVLTRTVYQSTIIGFDSIVVLGVENHTTVLEYTTTPDTQIFLNKSGEKRSQNPLDIDDMSAEDPNHEGKVKVVLRRRRDEIITIGKDIDIMVQEIEPWSKRIKLGITAPLSVGIVREELLTRRENEMRISNPIAIEGPSLRER